MQQQIKAGFATYREVLSEFILEQREYGQNALRETGFEEFSRIIIVETNIICEIADAMIRNSILLEAAITQYPDQRRRLIDLLNSLDVMLEALPTSAKNAMENQFKAVKILCKS
jgi:hypothetical protein